MGLGIISDDKMENVSRFVLVIVTKATMSVLKKLKYTLSDMWDSKATRIRELNILNIGMWLRSVNVKAMNKSSQTFDVSNNQIFLFFFFRSRIFGDHTRKQRF